MQKQPDQTTRRSVLEEVLQELRKLEEEWRSADEMGYRAAGHAVELVEELLKQEDQHG